ncbi:MAG TPA: HEAT repeat domain-containing protein [Polyangiaceae bacterium]|nr:HEAT repeat domain-containing protein [Polyangiaceae bacterium]
MTASLPDLRSALDDPGFTPGALHLEPLFALLASASREEAPRVERVLSRGGERALSAVLARLASEPPDVRARLVNVLGRLADPRASEALRRCLADSDARVARRAATALGKLEYDPENDRALQSAWATGDLGLKKSVAEALGKAGGPEADALLARAPATDAELTRVVANARLLLARRHSRKSESAIATDRRLGARVPLLLRARRGLAELLADELRPLGTPHAISESVVELDFDGALSELFVARTALEAGVRIELGAHTEADLPDAVARAVASDTARRVFASWTHGAPRYRVSFASGGHRRALVFRIAAAVGRAAPELVNDPRGESWELVVVERPPSPHLVLVPRAYEDPRFSYRRRDVRAASHPTIAAALARTAGARPDDVVWDPFLGSGLELVERARLGAYRTLLGSDLEPEALDAARENLGAAGVTAELRLGDATRLAPKGVTLIVTNPPMGRRLARDRTLGPLLAAFVAHAARVLASGGRLVWLSPLPELTRRAATEAGLALQAGPVVDLGGFDAELQTLRKT